MELVRSKLLLFQEQRDRHKDTAPGGEGGQCVDLCENWIMALGGSRTWANAVDLLRVAPASEWDIVQNSPTNYPPEGAVVVWGPYAPLDIGPMGHCAIALRADGSRLEVFEQNFPEGAPCGVGRRRYGGVVGWMVRHGS